MSKIYVVLIFINFLADNFFKNCFISDWIVTILKVLRIHYVITFRVHQWVRAIYAHTYLLMMKLYKLWMKP